ncbi:NAD(P)H-dependent flavin oxidoreductase [Croceicoccus marinus]|uniref:NAD(P)H-dependent flavin oxidoreductase n=1 Tax=Croceicoccus marinus TaxID=450378 RepID=UPI001E49487B|nr:nitronate monooxygenase [Croceicoccus marinus]
MTDRSIVDQLQARLRLPAIVAPMFLISGPDIVIAAARAGIMGMFPAPNARTIHDLSEWLARITRELTEAGREGMWAINMIVHPTYDRFDAELDLVCEYKPQIVVTALGNPRRPMDRIHAYGGSVFADVISPAQARKAADAGADGLILVASGAGGHTGHYSHFAFVEEVRSFWDGPLVLAGAIGSGNAIRAALTLGADFAYMGTRFIATREAQVAEANREMLVRSGMEDIVTTRAVTGIASNWMRESLEASGFTAEMLEEKKKVDFSNMGDTKAWKSIWGAGHSVGRTCRIQTVAEVVDELADEYAGGTSRAQSIERWSTCRR